MPVNNYGKARKYENKCKEWEKTYGCIPSKDEIVSEMNMSEEQIEAIKDSKSIIERNRKIVQISENHSYEGKNPYERISYSWNKNPDIEWKRLELDELVNKTIKKERDREIIKMRFGLNGYKEMTLKEIGDKLNRTSEAIRKREEKSLKKLSYSLKPQSL